MMDHSFSRRSMLKGGMASAAASIMPTSAFSAAAKLKQIPWELIGHITYRAVPDFRLPSDTFRQRQVNQTHRPQRLIEIDSDLGALKAPSLAWKALVQRNRDLRRAREGGEP